MRKLSLLFSLLLTAVTVFAQQPFAKYGYKVKVATFSGGRYDEFHDKSRIVEIGSVKLDTKTGKIVGYVDNNGETEDGMKPQTVSRFLSIDPLAEKYYSISPYAYCLNNPLMYIDPDGKDVYRYDDKTGDFILFKKTDDKFDQIGQFKYDKKTKEYTLKTSRKGEAKTRTENIEKGILSDGANFRNQDNYIAVGGKDQASVEGVRNFVIEMSELTGKEIGGFEIAKAGESNASGVYLSYYKNNTDQRASTNFNLRLTGATALNQIEILTKFHTHLSRFPETDRTRPSGSLTPGGDMEYKRRQSGWGIKKFIILTKGYAPIPY